MRRFRQKLEHTATSVVVVQSRVSTHGAATKREE